MLIKVTIEKEYELGYTIDRLYTFPCMFELDIYTNGSSYVLGQTVYVN